MALFSNPCAAAAPHSLTTKLDHPQERILRIAWQGKQADQETAPAPVPMASVVLDTG
jgi:hypothetical protein